MFVDKSIGGSLRRKQLKWLLVAFVVVAIAAVLLILSKSMKEPATISAPAQPLSDDMATSVKPTQEEVDKQLESLATEDAKDPAPKPTQEEIERQLEELSRQ